MASNSMGGGNGDLGCPSSGMATNPFFASGWDPVVSLGQHESLGVSSLVSQAEFGNSHYPDVMQNHAFSSSSHLIHYPSDPSFVRLPKLPSIGSGNFAEPGGPFGYTDCGDPFKDDSSNRSKDEGMQSCEEPQLSEETVAGASPAGSGRRRKRGPESDTNLRTSMNAVELQKGPFNVSSGYEHDEKISKTELNANNRGKQTVKQAKDTSQGEEAEKDSYIHVRARRGQATNSHSLAERVRREKISERMKALQDLVPGCNKITGKAVMLDEIINYVQSLQQQVEFLSMKLATVNPDVNVDIERILSKDILYSRGGNVATLGFSPGMNSLSQPHPNGIYSASMPLMSNTNLLYPPLNQPMLDTELQGFLQTGFDPSSGMNSLASNNGNHLIPPSNRLFAIELRSPTRDTLSCAGRLKPEL